MKKLFVILILLFSFVPCFAKDIKVTSKDGIYVFKIPLKEYGNKIKPYVAPKITTATEVFNNKDLNFKLVVNGGYFNIKTGSPVSSVVIDGVQVENIFDNKKLVQSLEKQGRLKPVLRRSELTIIEDGEGKCHFDIKKHSKYSHQPYKIKHSIQAGPMIYPSLRLEEESFIKYDENNEPVSLAADVLKRRERTIIGLKHGFSDNNYLYIIIFTSENKVDLKEASEFCRKLGLTKALNMDGGASTSINYKDIEVYSANDGQRRVKSFLVIEN